VGKSTASYALDVSGVVSATSFVGSGALLTGISSGGGSGAVLKNFVINGDMIINQRYPTAYSSTWSTVIAGSTGPTEDVATYVVDRFCVFRDSFATGSLCMQGIFNTSMTSYLPFTADGITYYAAFGRQSGDTNTNKINMRYGFEQADTLRFFGNPVTLSFYYQTGANFSGSSLSFGFLTASGLTPAINVGMSFGIQRGQATIINTSSTTASPSTSWVHTSFTTTLPAITNWFTSGSMVGIFFSYTPTGTAGTNDYVNITGVQVEMGTSATSFEMCSYATKLTQCQRYYTRLSGINVMFTGIGGSIFGGSAIFVVPFSPPMRLINNSPGMTLFQPAFVSGHGCVSLSGNAAAETNTGLMSIIAPLPSSVLLMVPCSVYSAYSGPLWFSLNSGGYLGFSAEV